MNSQPVDRDRLSQLRKEDDRKYTLSVYAPTRRSLKIQTVFPEELLIEMTHLENGYFISNDDRITRGTKYFLIPDDEQRVPDPASHFQPEGVHGPSEFIDHTAFQWTDEHWIGRAMSELIMYEIHVGTFTPEGTFDAIIPRLDDLLNVGINTIELMPVSQFPGERNWGYDGVYPYAVQNSYGGPDGLKRLVDAAHSRGICVFLDVVYNHQGPEGNYFSALAPFFSDRYEVPWGKAINFDGEWSDGIRNFYIDNVAHWIQNYHLDGLRLDAIHTMFDISATHVLQEVNLKCSELRVLQKRQIHLVAESDFNDPKVVKPISSGGFGFSGQWLDDFHHALYVLLDPEGHSRYEDFGSMEQLAKSYRDGFVLDGGFVKFRKKHYGKSSATIDGDHFVVFNQNHDQIGNRPKGERLTSLIDFQRQKLATACLILSPYVPMFFMGEEYGEDQPFFFFVSHSDKALIEAVSEGRKKEFEGFGNDEQPPEAQDEHTFKKSKIDWEKRSISHYAILLQWTTALLALRKNNKALKPSRHTVSDVSLIHEKCLLLLRHSEEDHTWLFCFLNFSETDIIYVIPEGFSYFTKLLDSTFYSHGKSPEDLIVLDEFKVERKITLAPLSASVFEGVRSTA